MIKRILLILSIILIGAYFRFTNLNWDQGAHLHPDERFLVMVGTSMKWPNNFSDYLNTSISTLNPHNIDFGFFVYGTFPVIVVKLFASLLNSDSYGPFVLVGRFISAILDTGSIFLVFILARRLSKSFRIGALSAFIYAVSSLPIQLSHFFTSDPYLIFFLLLSLTFISYSRQSLLYPALAGIFFAFALSSKISGVLFLPVIGLILLLHHLPHRDFKRLFFSGVIFAISLLISLRFSYPYLFSATTLIPTNLNPLLLENWHQLKSFDDPSGWFPPGVQWLSATKYIFPLTNIVYYGLGLPLAILFIVSLVFSLFYIRRNSWLSIPIIGILLIFLYQGGQFVMVMRYFYPLYLFVAILCGYTLAKIKNKVALVSLFAVLLVWPYAFTRIYTVPHTRQTATDWIFKNIPFGSSLSCEVWDDCVPLGGSQGYTMVEFPFYDPDSPAKWQVLSSRLATTDYLVLSSNRLYGSISGVPQKYPQTSQFYRDLFAGRLNFKKVAEFTSRPHLPLPFLATCIRFPFSGSYGDISNQMPHCSKGPTVIDDYSDETWTVYDHPKVTIFKRI